MLYTFTCPQCGKIVSTKIKSKKYCSPECKYKYNFKSHAVHEPRECPECHKVFITSTAARLYCSRECYYKSQWVTGGIFSTQENKEVEIARRVEKKYSRFEYIGGYDGADGHIYLRCRDCSSSFKTSVQNLKAGKGGKLNCPICSKVLKETEQKRETEERQRKAIQKRQEQKRIRFWGQDFEQQQFKSCAKCGGLMLGK